MWAFLIKLRNFFFILRIFYWYALKAGIKALVHKDLVKTHQFWSIYTWEFFRFKLYRCRNSEEMRRQKTIILTSHRSQADFWLHNIITENQCNFLSRLLVGIIFFVFGIFGYKHIWFFNRSGKIDHNKFNQWLNKKFSQSEKPSLVAYPEGHRMAGSVKVQKEKLKTGMIKYAYRQKIPVQFLMTFGNENVFNQKKMHMGWNQKIYFSFSKVVDPSNFESEAEFVNFIKDQFTRYFDQIYRIYNQGGEVQQMNLLRNATD